MNIVQTLSQEFGIQNWQTEAVIRLLDEGNTLPFIARYRKEQHGELDDQKLRQISERLTALRNLEKRKEEILDSLTKLEVLTDDLKAQIEAAATLSRLEDLYRPYRPKRRTRASIAREKGLEPLAGEILLQMTKSRDLNELTEKYIDPEKDVNSPEEAVQGAMDIIAETISDSAEVREKLRNLYRRECQITTKATDEEPSVYDMYADYHESIRTIPGHRVLAIDRGEKEGKLKVKTDVNRAAAGREIQDEYIAHTGSFTTEYVRQACDDAYDRLIEPSLSTEFRNDLTAKAQTAAIRVFASNLKPLLMQPPVRGKTVIGMDPGIRTGCKIAVVDATGKVLDTAVIFPLPAQGRVNQAKEIMKKLILRHGVTVAAIGNGTASRETEKFFVDLMHEMNLGDQLGYVIVSEAGASV